MTSLMPALSSAKANVTELERLRESQTQLQLRGIHVEAAAANFPAANSEDAAEGGCSAEEELCSAGVCRGDR